MSSSIDEPSILDGEPLPTVVPATVEDLRSLVKQAVNEQKAVYPFGGRTMFDLGFVPTKPGIAIDMRQLDQVIDYPARDMTITVQAGITIARLAEILRAERQRLAVDIPLPELATLGGAIATNASGPRRYGLGALRDYIIGISAVNDEGVEIKGGGRVVKNVAGYDMMKLFMGSLGTLGIITQVTLKLKPEPEASSLLLVRVTLDQASAILETLGATRTRPVCVELLDPIAARGVATSSENSWQLAIGFEDNAKAVAWQIEQFRQELPGELRTKLVECPKAQEETIMAKLRDFCLLPGVRLSFKANLLPSTVVDFCRKASNLAPAPSLQAHAGNGIVHGHVQDLTQEQAIKMLEVLGSLTTKANGNLIVTRCPAEWKTVLPVWGRATGDRILMKAIKAKLDPAGLFNPGRFVDGI